MMKRVFWFGVSSVAFVCGFAAVAYASNGVDVNVSFDFGEALRAIVSEFRSGDHGVAAALSIVAFVAAVRKWGSLKFPWLDKSPFPLLLALLGSFGATLATMGASYGSIWPAAKLAALAAGGFAIVAGIGRAVLDKWGHKLPSWLVSVLNLSLWLFSKPGEKAVTKAEKAGSAAVDANPADGVGDTTKIP